MALGAHQEYVVGGLPEAPLPSRPPSHTANGDAAAIPRPEVIHLRLSSQIIEQIAQQLEDASDDGGISVDLEGSTMAFHIGTHTFPLSKSSEYSSTPHDLFHIVPSPTQAEQPTALSPIGPVSYQLAAKAGSGATEIAAERLRLRERRDEEDARRTSNSAVLLEPGQVGGKKSKKTDRFKSTSSVASASTAKRSNPLMAIGTRNPTTTLPKAAPISTSTISAAGSESQPAGSEDFSVTNPSLRTRLIQLLAIGPIAQKAIAAQLGSAATSLLSAVASQDSQQQYILKDELCVEVRIAEWPGYTDPEVRSAVSDRVNLGLRKKRVGRSHEAWARLWPDGKIQRAPPEVGAEQKRAELAHPTQENETSRAPAVLESAYDSSTSISAPQSKKKKPTTLQRVAKAAKGKKTASVASATAKKAAAPTGKSISNVASSSTKTSLTAVGKPRQTAKEDDDIDIPIRKKPRTNEPVPAASPISTNATLLKQRSRSPNLERIPRRTESEFAESSNVLAPSTTTSAQRKKQSVDKAKAAAAEAERKRLERARDYTDSSEEDLQQDREQYTSNERHVARSADILRGRSASSKRSRSPSFSPHAHHAGRQRSHSYSRRAEAASTHPQAHRGVGPGAHAHSEPWLDVRTSADFARLAERFKRDYAEYAAGRDRVRKEGEWLEAERKVAELEEQARFEEEKARAEREREHREAIAAATSTKGDAAASAGAGDDSPEEGETSPILERDLERGMLVYAGSVSDGSRGFGPATSASTNPTTRSPSPAATWRDANDAVAKELSAAAAAAAGSGGVGITLGPPVGPMPFAELEKLVRRVNDLHGQLWRMKGALVEYKRRVGGRDRVEQRERERDGEMDRADRIRRDRDRERRDREWERDSLRDREHERGRDKDRDRREERQRS